MKTTGTIITISTSHLPEEDLKILSTEEGLYLAPISAAYDEGFFFYNPDGDIFSAAKALGLSGAYVSLLKWAFSAMQADILRLDSDANVVNFLPVFDHNQSSNKDKK
jgi:mannitol-specific phosphotransferase system IIBC component